MYGFTRLTLLYMFIFIALLVFYFTLDIDYIRIYSFSSCFE